MVRPRTVIKKYGDRRLYDTGSSRYVKLEDIAAMIRDGTDVEVLDARTGKDITRAVLTQIVVEEARDRETGLPLQLLRQLVMASDRATHEFLSWYLNGTLDLYRKAQEAFQSRFSEARQAVSNPMDFVRHLFSGQVPPPPRPDAELEELRLRVKELEARVAELSAAAAPAARKRRPRPRTPPESR